MSNIIDSIQLSGTTYQIQGSGGGVPESVFTAYTASTDSRIGEDEEVTAAALNALDEKIDSISGGGITSGEVQTMIDESISGKQDTMSAGTSINITDNVISLVADNALSKTSTNPVVNSAITDAVIVEGTQGSVDGHLVKKVTITKNFTYDENVYMFRTYKGGSYGCYTENFQMILTNSSGGTQTYTNPEQTFSDDKVDFVVDSRYYFSATTKDDWYITKITFKETENPNGINWEYKWNRNGYPEMDAATAIHDYIYPELSGKTSSAQVQTMIDEAISGKQDTLSAGTGINITDNVISATGGGGGNPTVELTQAQYDALVTAGTVQADTYYIITDAQAGDLTNYYTKTETNTLLGGKADTATTYTKTEVDNAITAATSTKQDTLTAGRGIDINASNVVSVSLPISAGTGSNSIIEGNGTKASGFSSHAEGSYSNARGSYSHAEGFGANANGASSHAEGGATNADGSYSHAEGDTTTAKGNYSHTEGRNTIANNQSEHASGQYNVSNKANTTFGNSGNTLFSVGNGTADNARHNAFEIRQNGDIYLTKDGQDVKLQDQLGGSSITVDTALDSGSTNPVENRVIYNKIDEVEQVTAAGLNAVNDKFGGLKLVSLTQAEYNALATKDASTLYIIVN